MGTRSRCWALAWTLVTLLTAQRAETQDNREPSWVNTEAEDGQKVDRAQSMLPPAQRVNFIPPITVSPSMSTLNPAHNGRVCSTWGNFHYKTFDGNIFRFPGLCNYVLASHCRAAYEEFNVQVRRELTGTRPTISRIVLKVEGLVLEVANGSMLVNGQREELPYSRAGLLVERSSSYIKITVRMVLTFFWNGGDSALLELDPKYANQTCGLCGDFNGLPVANEFYAHNVRLTALQFGNLQKLDGPTEQCQDPLPTPATNCTDIGEDTCRHTLLGPAFAQCNELVDPEPYVTSCVQDLCRCPSCPCATFAEYSRQCAHAGGRPQNWRGPDLCPQTCPVGMQHQECSSPCTDTCSNPERAQLCEDHCEDGCFCPPGTVLDDVTHSGCVPLKQCPCTYRGRTYAPGAAFSTSCSSCTCSGGRWQCEDLPCPGTCSIQGGSHISTYDEKLYDLHGDCSYILSKRCDDSMFTMLAELRRCGLTDTESCLKSVTLSLHGGDMTIRIQANGAVFMNSIYTQLPTSAANITIFKPSSFFVLLQTGFGLQLQVQLVPLMQAYIRLDPTHRGQMCGLCGNFNQNQADDFTALSGVVEGTGSAFANTWKTQAACPNSKNIFEDPCSLSVENEKYAQHWCAMLTNPTGAFAPCHSIVNPASFHSNCMFDTCNCEKSEDCLCAALSAYVRACAAKGVLLNGWREGVCAKYMSSCPKSQSYEYVVDACQPTCRSLSEVDVTCGVSFVPVDGCTCPVGTYLDDAGTCVPAQECPCYLRGTVVAPGEVVHDNGVVCSCSSGKLSCLGALVQSSTGCTPPMVYVNCSNASAGAPGAECLRSCHTLDVDCYSTHCVSGCVCPPGLVSDGNGGCIAQEDCPCVHNEATYQPGDTISVDCNTCTCKNRRWECTSQPCLGTCVAYGDGHFITFDGGRYNFEGDCKYMLAQDYCTGNTTNNGNFRIITENIPCGTTGVTCSKAIKIFLESYELILTEGHMKVVERGPSGDLPYKIRYMGIYLVIEARSGLIVSWDRKTSIFIRLHPSYQGKVCGLCGNFDGNAINDFTTRSQSVVGDVLEFGNSWKFSPTCPDALAPRDPCTANPYRKSWAQKQCSILHSAIFAACQSQVDSTKYYEACVSDACACDSGGDCECFCTAVAAYAQACHDAGVCVSWRSPEVCPLFCDYYNPHGECEWHYQPCGAPCMRTCRNPSGRCLHNLPGLEGCYPKCPPSKPFFSEDEMKCVAQCGCYDVDGNYHEVNAKVATAENCQSCTCTSSGIQCEHSLEACACTYEGKTFGYKDVVYNTTDGLGACLVAICGDNGTIHRNVVDCLGTSPTTPFIFSSTATPPSTAGSVTPTVCVREVCIWSDWYDSNLPEPGMEGGDFETFQDLMQRGYQVCGMPADIECRAASFPKASLEELGQRVDCDRAHGLTCLNREQSPPLCHNYELRVQCCVLEPCGPSTSLHTSPPPFSSVTTQPTATTETPVSIPKTETTPPKYLPTTTQIIYTKETTLQSTPNSKSTAALQTQSTSATMTMSQSVRSSESPGTTACQPKCQWTGWFDEDYPKSEEAGGDIESYDKIRRVGGDICEQPQDIECQAENFPNSTLQQVGQIVHCDASFGLVCRNDEQKGTFRMCYNYRIRVLCCSQSHCGEHTTPLASTTRRPFPTAGPTSQSSSSHTLFMSTPGSTGTEVPTPPLETSMHPGSTSVLPAHTTLNTSQMPTSVPAARTSPTVPPITGTSPGAPSTKSKETQLTKTTDTINQGTSSCQPRCEWTEWFDVDFPTSGVSGGDMETFDNIRAAGGKMCRVPEKIECRAENYPEVSLDQIGQVLSCSLQEGLVCKNKDQQGRFNMCFNYNVRVLCCDDYRHCTTTAGTTSTSTSTTATTGPNNKTESVPPTTRATATSVHTPTTNTLTEIPQTSTTTSSKPTSQGLGSSGTHSTSAITHMPHFSPSTAKVVTNLTSSQPMPRSPTTAAKSSSSSLVSTPVLTTTPLVPTLDSRPTSGRTISSGFPTRSPIVTTMVTSTGTVCEPRCTWTDWFDESYPVPGLSGGDFETYNNIRAAGNAFCQAPVDIQCRSELQPDTPLRELDQVVQCDVNFGLICKNREQHVTPKYCHNYHIRVLCCEDRRHCPSTPATTGTTPTTTGETTRTSTMVTVTRTTSTGTTPVPTTPEATSTLLTTTLGSTTTNLIVTSSPSITPTSPLVTTSPILSTASTKEMSTACEPRCTWTDWFDESYPVPGLSGGDFETYNNIRAAGNAFCQAPVDIQCRSELQPDTPLRELDQVVQCNVNFGLICKNREQHVTPKYCHNYHIRVLCCEDRRHCPSTPATTGTTPTTTGETTRTSTMVTVTRTTSTGTTPVPTTPEATTPEATSTLLTTTLGSTTTNLSVTSSPSITPTSPLVTTSPILSTASTKEMSTACEPRCTWTDWFDESYPVPGLSGGDFETYDNIRAAGNAFCQAPVDIQCRSELQPDTPLRELDQVVQCDVSFGLICKNREQHVTPKYCHNYHIRVLCCEDRRHCPSTPATTGTTPTTTGETTRTSTMVTLTKTTSTGTTPVPTTPEATTPEATSTLLTTTLGSTTTNLSVTSSPSITPTSPLVTTSPILSTASTKEMSTACEPRCTWTDWFDESYPVPGLSGGDFETYNNIRAAGNAFCQAPVDIQCRSELQPDTPLRELDQVVQCNVNFGLICKNREQHVTPKYCHNYHIRVLCCEDRRHCPSTPATTGTTPTTTGETTRTSTMVTVTRTTSTGTTPVPTTPEATTPEATSTLLTTTLGSTTTNLIVTSSPSITPTSPLVTTSPILSTASTKEMSTACEPRCTWTDWFDESYPVPGLSGGDFETYDNIRAAGNAFCQAPVDIQCRSELQPDTPLRELNQVVQCDLALGLVCRNSEQTGRFQICHNYHVRVLCCDYSRCQSTPAPTMSTDLKTSSSPTSTPPFSPTALPSSSLSPSAASTTATSLSTRCQPACRWTDWLDSDQPQPGRYGGDIETYYHIMDAGERLCDKPAAIECEAQRYPGVPLGALGQVVLCSVQFGLICRNHKQTQGQTCLNYHVRVYCCDEYSHCGTTRASTHTPETLISTSKTVTSVHTPTSNTLTEIPQTSTTTSSKPTSQGLGSSGTHSTSAITHMPHFSPSTAKVVTNLTSSQPMPRSPTTAAKSSSSSLASTPVLTTTPLVPTLDSRPTSGRTISSGFPTRSPIVTTMVTSTGTVCEPRCTWTDWFDESYPVPGLSGGDFETYNNIRAAGNAFCQAPVDIQCRSELQPDTPLRELDQVVQCNVNFGLICKNREQHVTPKYCHNYHIRVLCCEDRRHCPSTPATTGTTPTTTGETTRTSTMVTVTKTTSTGTTPVPTTPEATTPEATSTLLTTTLGSTTTNLIVTSSPSITPTSPLVTTSPILSTASTKEMSTACEPRCTWTDWFDESYPVPGLSGGDFETYDNIRAASNAFCQAPVDIQCRSELQPDTPLRELDQVVQCDVNFGLICKNREQHVTPKYCHNYHIRVLCCEDRRHCPSTPATTGTTPTTTGETTRTSTVVTVTKTTSTGTTPVPTTPEATTPEATSTLLTTTLGSTTTNLIVTSSPSITPTSPLVTTSPILSTASTKEMSTACEPRCTWTDWFDESYPVPGLSGGDFETYDNIRAAGNAFCQAPVDIQCRSELQPDTPLRELDQVVQCDVNFGLICKNREQHVTPKYCHNYHIRVLCCEDRRHCPSTPATTGMTPTTTGETTRTSTMVTVTKTTSTGTTPVPTTPEATTPEATSTLLTTTLGSTTTNLIVTSSPSITPTSPLVTTSPILSTASTKEMSTACEPRCTWTDWFDESYPVPGLSGGDFETYNNIRAAGNAFCQAPVDIQCRSELQPDTPLRELDQVVQCDVNFGLICKNREQHVTPKYCHNYHIRVLCCEDRRHCPSTPVTTGTTPTTTGETTRTSTMVTVTRTTSMGTSLSPTPLTTSSFVPSSGTGSTVTLPTTISESQSSGLSSSLPAWLPTSSLTTSSSTVHTPLLPTSSSSLTTSRCYCQAFGELFLPGEVIYNKTDKAGCHFYAICNQQCNIDRFQDTCPTTLPPASSEAPSSIPMTMSTPPPSPAPGCDHTIPPRQVNETWTLADCTVAKCEGDNRIVLLEPKPVANVTCVNQYQPVKVLNQSDPCNYHYECECICTSWGDSYSTFDGTVFTFADNCTYVLLREIHPQYGNLSVLMDHQYCAAEAVDASFCPRAILIYYLSMEVVLTVTDLGDGKMQSLILFDGKHVSSGFSKNGVSVSETVSGTMGVHIPAIGAYIIFDGSIFQAQLSYSHFNHNTEGQCGTCTNSQVDDCRRPDGTIAPTCKDMARHWLVPDDSKDGCRPPTSPPPSVSTPSTVSSSSTSLTASTPSTEPTPCPPSPLCELILSPVFEDCHNLVPPSYFFMACVSDSCQGDRPQVPCESLEAYAALCRNWGACSDWRNATNGLCDFSCPPTKVYKPCGPVQPETCESRIQSPMSPGLAEGCFCPDGEILFNAHTGVCVPECPCVGPDGFPKFPGEQWVSNCQSCVCEDRPATVHCRPVQCEVLDEPQECGRPGFVNVTRPRADNPCCPETLCVCNVTTCPQDPPECGPGLELIRTQEEGACCPTFSCRPQLCNYNGTAYGIGAIFPGAVPCHTCTCMSRDAQPPTVECEEDICDTTCPKGFEYRKTAGQCCGDCVQITCLTPDEQPVQPNDTWVNHRLDNCTEYRCEATDGSFMLVPQPVICPDVTACRGVLRKRGCCYYCEEEDKCQVQANTTVLRHLDCVTDSAVSINFCEGSCPGFSKYSAEAQTMERHCACCQETKTHEEEVMLLCPDGTRIRHSYVQVDECGCGPACLPSAPSDTFLT